MLFEQRDLFRPLPGAAALAQPVEPAAQQIAAGFVQRVAQAGLGEGDARSADAGVEAALAGQAPRVLEGGTPFREALMRAAGWLGAALLSGEAYRPFVRTGLEALALRLLDLDLAARGAHQGRFPQHAGDELGRRQIGRGLRGLCAGRAECDGQQPDAREFDGFHRCPESMTGTSQ